jgi:hypothetical protein
MKKIFSLCVLASVASSGCAARTGLSDSLTDTSCTSTPPQCVQSAPNPCDAPTTVTAQCDDAAHQWICPTGSRVYARAADSSAICRPFHGASGIDSVGPWGLSAMTQIPTDDGRCLWIADSAQLSDGTMARNVAFEPDITAPFGTCPTESVSPPTPIVTVEGPNDPTILVQIDGGYRLGGATHVLYRIFKLDSTADFGAIEIGGGVAHWDPSTQRIVVPSPQNPFPWGLDLDLGDAQLVSSDGVHAFVWGCAQPTQNLTQGCELARLDANDSVELFSNSATWISSVDASQGAVLFRSGTWSSSVATTPDGLRHVYAVDFGSTIQSDVASDATGPWSPSADLAQCDLPSDDPQSFCAGPTVHLAISDPFKPDELAITYGVGSSSLAGPPPNTTPEDYWPRLIWAQ